MDIPAASQMYSAAFKKKGAATQPPALSARVGTKHSFESDAPPIGEATIDHQ